MIAFFFRNKNLVLTGKNCWYTRNIISYDILGKHTWSGCLILSEDWGRFIKSTYNWWSNGVASISIVWNGYSWIEMLCRTINLQQQGLWNFMMEMIIDSNHLQWQFWWIPIGMMQQDLCCFFSIIMKTSKELSMVDISWQNNHQENYYEELLVATHCVGYAMMLNPMRYMRNWDYCSQKTT